jgi:hypothetical protein
VAVPQWMLKASINANKPKYSIVGRLLENLGGKRPGRSRSTIHASDITKPDFCPRAWAFGDIEGKTATPEYLAPAMEATFNLGLMTAKTLIEQWAGDYAIGNWICIRCGEQRVMVSKPNTHPGCHNSLVPHIWEYKEVVIDAPEYGVSGSIDVLFDVGVPQVMITELKIKDKDLWESLKFPEPEHRLRTNLYMHLIANSTHPFKDRFNLHEARVLYVSRGYGKMNQEWNQVLPFKEYVIERDGGDLAGVLGRAKELNVFRNTKVMPTGICPTAFDKYAKKCQSCKECFSGIWPAGMVVPPSLEVGPAKS